MSNISLLIILVISILLACGCTDNGDTIDNVIIVAISSDGKYKATTEDTNKNNELLVTVENTEDGSNLLTTAIRIPGGYHNPIISMSWKDTKTLYLSVDHDFGEGNIMYIYNVGDNELKKTGHIVNED